MNKLGTDGYVKTEPSQQDTMTPEEIAAKLSDYVLVDEDELPQLKLNAHIRYIKVIGHQKQQYRSGGFLKKNVPPVYMVLSTNPDNTGKTWSVQYNGNIIYRKKTPQELISSGQETIIKQCDLAIEKKNEEIGKLKIKLKNCHLQNEKLTQQIATTKSTIPIKKKPIAKK